MESRCKYSFYSYLLGAARHCRCLLLEDTNRKRRKTFTVPEIIFEPDLCLSPHIFLLAILFRHQAFASPTLNNNPHQLDTMQIHPMDEELELGLKPEFADRFVFRRAVKTALGLQTSEKQISSGMINEWVKTVGKLAGFKYNTICYTLRYMAGNVMDKNGMLVPLSPLPLSADKGEQFH